MEETYVWGVRRLHASLPRACSIGFAWSPIQSRGWKPVVKAAQGDAEPFFPDGNRAAQRTPEARTIDSVEVRRTSLVDEKRAAHRPRVGVCGRAKRGCQPRSPMQRTRASMALNPRGQAERGDEYSRRLSVAPGEIDGSRAWLGIGVSPSWGSARLDVQGTIGQIDGARGDDTLYDIGRTANTDAGGLLR